MSIVELVTLGLGLGFLGMAIHLAANVIRTWAWLRREVAPPPKPTDEVPLVVLLIPVLREQAVIETTLRHLATLDYPQTRLRVVAVTTAREDRERREAFARIDQVRAWLRAGEHPSKVAQRLPGLGPASLVVPLLLEHGADSPALSDALERLPTTAELIDRMVGEHREGTIRRIHYPFTNGGMAQQANWGARYVFEVVDHGIDPASTWIGLYNADSRPHRDTLAHLVSAIQRTRDYSNPPVAFQQHSLYRVSARGAGWWLSSAAAAWQSRWSLAVEHPRARRSTALLDAHVTASRERASISFALRCPFNYAIGHGLFVRLRELVQMNYLPEHTANEDAPFGYLLTLTSRALRPLPVFDDAEVPSGWRALLSQQGGWFRGPLDASHYRALARVRRLDRMGTLLPAILAMRVRWDAIAWIAGPYCALAIVAAAIGAPGLWTGVALACLVVYLVVPTALSQVLAPWPVPCRRPSTVVAILALPVFYVLHGLGPTLYLIRLCLSSARGIALAKYKTER